MSEPLIPGIRDAGVTAERRLRVDVGQFVVSLTANVDDSDIGLQWKQTLPVSILLPALIDLDIRG